MAIGYGTADQVITITPTSLAADASRESTVITNTAFSDVLVFGMTKTVAGSPATDLAVYVLAYGTVGGTTYPDTVTGADAALTLTNPTQLPRIGVIRIPTGNVSHKAGPWSLRAAFGGTMPSRWGIVVLNKTNLALSATAGDHVFTYQGISDT